MPKKQQKRRKAPPRNESRLRYAALAMVTVVVLGVVFVGALALGTDRDGGASNPPRTADPSGFGPAPTFDGNIAAVIPEHGSTVSQAETRTTDPGNPRGVCARIRFEETTGQWYRMAVDGREVTAETIWILSDPENPETGRLCYDPPEGLPPGIVEAAVSVQDPAAFGAPPREVVGWKFEVVE